MKNISWAILLLLFVGIGIVMFKYFWMLATYPPATLQCDRSIETVANPPDGFTVIRGIAALPTSRGNPMGHQVRSNDDGDARARFFAKSGLLIRSGSTFKLVVPEALRDKLSISWGIEGRTWELTVPSCGEGIGWKAYAGGYWVKEVGCMDLILQDGAHEEVIQVGIGAPCKGQSPPLASSER